MTGTLDLRPLVPAIIVAATGLVVLLVQAYTPRGKSTPSAPLSLAGLLAALGAVWLLASGTGRGAVLANAVTADEYSLFFQALLLGIAAVAVLLSPSYLRANGLERGEYYALLLLSTAGMFVLVSSVDFMALFVGLELMSVPIYALAGFDRKKLRSNESALKYFLTGAFASGVLLYGVALVYGATGETGLMDIVGAVTAGIENPTFLLIGSALILIGLGFKVAAVPFHMWTPDVYQGAPTPVTAFMAVGAKVGGFHPLQTFAGIDQAIDNIPGSTFAIETDEPLLTTLKVMANALDGQWIRLKSRDKVAYHAAAVFACNYLVTLVKLSTDLWETYRIPPDKATAALLPLLRGTLNNIETLGIPQCLTGPIARGDIGTVSKHIKTLHKKAPALMAPYTELGRQTIPIALAKGKIDKKCSIELGKTLKAN